MGKENELVPIGSAAKVEEIQAKREAIKEANAVPFPGALKDAFAIAPEIVVGDYKIRPFYEIDFEFLISIGDPLNLLVENSTKEDFAPRGKPVWQICFMFTHGVDEVEALLKQGIESFDAAAKKEFCGRFQLAGLMEIIKAVLVQRNNYWNPQIGFESIEEDGSKKK